MEKERGFGAEHPKAPKSLLGKMDDGMARED